MTTEPTRTGLVLDISPDGQEGQLREVDTDRVLLSFDLNHPFAPVVADILWKGLRDYAASSGIPHATFSKVSVQ